MIKDLQLDRLELRRKIRKGKLMHFMINKKTYLSPEITPVRS